MILQTERLILRPWREEDAEALYTYARDPEVGPPAGWKPHTSVAYTKRYLEYLAGRYRLGMHYEWALVLREEGRMIGTCGFANFDCAHNTGEIGYVLNPAYQGKGLMQEAAERVMRFGFSVLGLHRIEARYMVGNDASRRLMERLGMREEGVRREAMLVKGAYRDIGGYAILAKEFRAE